LRGAGMRIDIVKRSPSASGRRPLSIRIPGVPSCAARTLAVINPSTALAGWLARITPRTAVGSRSAPSLSWISARNPVARADCCATTGERRRRGALRASPRGAVASGPRRRVARAPRAPPAAPPRQESRRARPSLRRPWCLERLRFIQQHDGNAVPHLEDQPAVVTDQLLGLRAVLEFALALGADQDLQQFLVEHAASLVVVDAAPSRRERFGTSGPCVSGAVARGRPFRERRSPVAGGSGRCAASRV